MLLTWSVRTTAWLSAGAVRQSFALTNRITTSRGHAADRSFTVNIAGR